MRLGFIGTGTITSATITGLLTNRPELTVQASRRSEQFSRPLVERFPQIALFDDNAALANASDVVVLAVRPTQLETALEGVVFKAGQTVISYVSGLSLDALQALAPQSAVAHLVPLPMIARGEGPILAFPELPLVRELFGPLSELIVPESEATLKALSPPSAFMSSFFTLQNALIAEMVRNGAAEASAVRYVQALLASLSQTALVSEGEARLQLPVEHETPGGLNYRVRIALSEAGWFDRPNAELARVHALPRDQLQK